MAFDPDQYLQSKQESPDEIMASAMAGATPESVKQILSSIGHEFTPEGFKERHAERGKEASQRLKDYETMGKAPLFSPEWNDASGRTAEDVSALMIGSVNPAASKTKGVKVVNSADFKGKVPKQHIAEADVGKSFGENHRLNTAQEVYYAVKDGKVVGHLGLDDAGSVKASYVDPEFRRQGISTKLYEGVSKDYGNFASDELTAMEPAAKKLWDKLKSKYPDRVTKTKKGYVFEDVADDVAQESPKNLSQISESAELPMDEASRMARAKEMGFDTEKTYYHGTTSDIDRILKTKFDDRVNYAKGFHGAEDADHASVFAGQTFKQVSPGKYEAVYETGGNIVPFHIKVNNPINGADAAPKEVFEDVFQKVKGIFKNPEEYKTHAAKMPFGQFVQTLRHSDLPRGDLTKILKKHGYDGMNYKGEVIVFEPSQIRSKFAEFDPKKSKSGKISAAIAGASALGAGALSGGEAQASDTIRMQGPDGKVRVIPRSLKGEAIAAGGRVVK